MANSRKRKFEEIDVSEIEGPLEGATVSGIVTELSPVKVSKKNSQVKYFQGKVTDGVKTVRMVAFDPTLRSDMELSRIEKKPVSIVNCQIKESSQVGTSEYEILASAKSKVESSPTKSFSLPADLTAIDPDCSCAEVKLIDIRDCRLNERVTVAAKVVEVMEPAVVSSRKLRKQDCTIADPSSCCKIVLWEDDIGKLHSDVCYRLKNVTVRSFNNAKYLSLSEKAVVEEITDIGEVADVESDEEFCNTAKVLEGELIAVLNTDQYRGCITCKGRVNVYTDTIGECTKCGAKMKLKKCDMKQTAKVIIQPEAGSERALMFFSEQLEPLVSNTVGASIADKLLSIDRVRLTISSNDVVISAKIVQ